MINEQNQSLDWNDGLLGRGVRLFIDIQTEGGEIGQLVLKQEQSGLGCGYETISSLRTGIKLSGVD
jgi:hypothetical protein